MLVRNIQRRKLRLTRRVGESVVIGDPTHPTGSVTVEAVEGGIVHLVCRFPDDVEVNRHEIAASKARGERW